MNRTRLVAAARAATVHLTASALIALMVAWIVLQVWFPNPYRDLAGGTALLWILVGVDVVCGPILTFILFNPKKPKRELYMDLSIVLAIQIAALCYGLYSIYLARPVALVFEVDRFVAVPAAQVDPAELARALPEHRSLRVVKPVPLLGVRSPKDGQDMLESVDLSIQGREPSVRADWWQSYESSQSTVKQRMKPVSALSASLTGVAKEKLIAEVNAAGKTVGQLFYLPMTTAGRLDDWIVLLDSDANVLGYAPVGGF